MALGASKSREPIREGLVSMLSPAIDTLLVCTLTALSILVTDVWRTSGASGVTLTVTAFESSLGGLGKILLLISAFFFAITSLFSYSYYGNKALSFLFGVKSGKYYDYFYLSTIIFGAILSMQDIMNIIDIAYALMAIPTMVSGFVLAPKVMKEAKKLFWEIEIGNAFNHRDAESAQVTCWRRSLDVTSVVLRHRLRSNLLITPPMKNVIQSGDSVKFAGAKDPVGTATFYLCVRLP